MTTLRIPIKDNLSMFNRILLATLGRPLTKKVAGHRLPPYPDYTYGKVIMTDPNSLKIDASIEESQADSAKRRAKGEFVRNVSKFRSKLAEDQDFPPEPDRYHLFVALNCPWCHRVTLTRNLLGLENSITLDITFPNRTDDSDDVAANLWEFNPGRRATLTGAPLPECTYDRGTGQQVRLVKEIYELKGSNEASVPKLYDKRNKRIVSNESADIIRMLNKHAQRLGSNISNMDRPDFYPEGKENAQLREEIDVLNEQIYININNGAYKAGFSSDQEVYAVAFSNYFDSLEALDKRLLADDRAFLMGDSFTEPDLRLFPTLFRHDPVYYVRMKLNAARILDYPSLWRWLCRIYALPGVAQSNSLVHCRQGYFGRSWNNVVALGPRRPMTYPKAYEHPELAR